MYDPSFVSRILVELVAATGEVTTVEHDDVLHVPHLAYRRADAMETAIEEVRATIFDVSYEETRRMDSKTPSPEKIREWVRMQIDANAGVTCAVCETEIGFKQGTSSPIGSLHRGCAREHEREHPGLW